MQARKQTIVTIETTGYTPLFCPETGAYTDKMPWETPGLKNKPWFKCPCNDYEFNKVANYNQHIQTKSHKRWLGSYNGQQTQSKITELEESLKEMRIDYGKVEQQNLRLMNKLKRRETTIDKLTKQNTELLEKNKQLVNDGYYSCTSEEDMD